MGGLLPALPHPRHGYPFSSFDRPNSLCLSRVFVIDVTYIQPMKLDRCVRVAVIREPARDLLLRGSRRISLSGGWLHARRTQRGLLHVRRAGGGSLDGARSSSGGSCRAQEDERRSGADLVTAADLLRVSVPPDVSQVPLAICPYALCVPFLTAAALSPW